MDDDALDKIRKNLEKSKDTAEKLRLTKENLESIKRAIASLHQRMAERKTVKKLYPKKKRPIYLPRSDFSSFDEYIDAMRKPLISESEANMVDWDKEFKDG